MSSKRRVYEVARDLEIDNKQLLAALDTLGVKDVKNHMSVLTSEDEDRVKKHLGKGGSKEEESSAAPARPRVVKRRPAVVRRRRASDGTTEESAATPAEPKAPQGQPIEPKPLAERPAAAAEPDEAKGKPAESKVSPSESEESARVSSPVERGAPAPSGATSESSDSPAAQPTAEQKSSEQAQAADKATAKEATAGKATSDEGQAPVKPTGAEVSSTEQESSDRPTAGQPTAGNESKSEPAAASGSAASGGGPAAARPTGGQATPSTAPAARPSQPPKRGVEVWEGRPGVPMHNHRPGARRSVYDAKAPMPGGPGRRGPGGRMMRGGPRQRGIGSFSKGRGGGPVTKERNAHKKVVRIEETVNLQTLAGNMGVKATDLLRKLFQLGMPGININSTLDADTAKIVGAEFGWEVEDVAVSEEEQLQMAQGLDETKDSDEDLQPRPPVVTVMGHVDHGKTSLLDALRKTNVVSGEAGGITQHIGAYSVTSDHGKITFLDTPGHAAFTQMRARGAQATDIVVLVVAADDGVMPQTKEAIRHAKDAGVPIVVAINKCDKPEAQPERVRRELSESGLVPEEWGGDTQFVEVSAHTRDGLPELLEQLALQAEILELKANPDKPASGLVIEAQLDKGRGPVATVLVTEGTLKRGDVVLAGAGYGKVRAMSDWAGRQLKKVGPSDPVSIIGLSDVPRAGDQVYAVKDLKTAQGIAETRKVRERKSLAPSAGNKPRTLEEIAQLMSEDEQLELKVIVKADVAGSAEAVGEALQGLSTEKVRVGVVLQSAGAITENDVNLAVAAGAIIVGFNVKPAGKAAQAAQREGVEIRQYSIIYNVLDDVKLAMEGLLAPKLVEKSLGKAEVRQTFRISKAGTVAGSLVVDGVIRRGAGARLHRGTEVVYEGKVSGLKRFKEDVREVKDGLECGISLENWNEVHVDDVIECFEIQEVKQSL